MKLRLSASVIALAVLLSSSLSAQLPGQGPISTLSRETVVSQLLAAFPEAQALVVHDHGVPVLEWYAAGQGPAGQGPDASFQLSQLIDVAAATIFGGTLAAGLVPSVDTKVEDYLAKPRGDGLFKGMSFRHFLSSSTGLGGYPEDLWFSSGKAIKYAYAARVLHMPGEAWAEEGGDSFFVLEALAAKTGMGFDELSRRFLFEPLGIRSQSWNPKAKNYYFGWCGLSMSIADCARLLDLYACGGSLDGIRILPGDFVKEALSIQVAIPEGRKPAPRVAGNGFWLYILAGPSPAPFARFTFGGSLSDSLQALAYGDPATGRTVLLWAPDLDDRHEPADYLDFVEKVVLTAR